jgi:hypothetical protein
MNPLPSVERLRELLRYEPETGRLYWLTTRNNNAKAGAVAGGKNGRYWYVEIDGCCVGAHRVAFALTHGRWATGHVDHINTDPSDNRAVNLREVTRSENLRNQRKAQAGSATGLLGVYRFRSKYSAKIATGGKQLHLGVFDTPEAAFAAYVQAKRELHGVDLNEAMDLLTAGEVAPV